MKYFELNVASYQGKTAHLSLLEHGAYLLMMMVFYSTEKPLPADRRVLYRLLRAESPAERKAIDAVAAEFWVESEGKLTNPRCDETLDRYLDWVSKQKANGSRGGRPKETHGLNKNNPSLTDGKPIANPSQSHGKANGSHDLESYSENDLPLSNSNPLPPLGKGVTRQRRSPERAAQDEGRQVWTELIRSDGSRPKRNAQIQAALDAIGGWTAVRMRTEADSTRLQREFCQAYAGQSTLNGEYHDASR